MASSPPLTHHLFNICDLLSLANIRANFCNFTNFFTSVETAAQYVAQHPGLAIVPVDAVFQIGKLLWERETIKSLIAEFAQRQG